MLLECSHGIWYDVNRKSLVWLMRSYMLNWCAQLEIIMCSTGNYWCTQWEIIMHSIGNYWCAQQEIIMCSTGHYWCAQWESIFGAPWEINGVHIVVVVNNIPNVKPAVICIPFKSTLTHEFDVWFLHERLDWIEDFVSHWIHVMGLGIENLKLSAAKWSFLSYYENM